MTVDKELLEILVCPETRQPVRLATARGARDRQPPRAAPASCARPRRRPGRRRLSKEGLMRQDGKVLYPVDDGIPVMLVEQSLQTA